MTMSGGENNIGLRFYGRVSALHNRLKRARYYRGHGVHSPFVYNIVRDVFMRDELLPGDHGLFLALRDSGISRRRATQLQNLAIHCGYASYGINRADRELCILTRDLSRDQILSHVAAASEAGHTVVVMSPCDGRCRQALCRQIVAAHRSTTVDNRGYLLIFNNNLPKQHFRI
ncbi:hypothetical protein [uncultured Alistipes sp.]|uniref:hypothetical protein n=2 Tax=uncultured Alistipes sp. TaxID=538949 RepID=UPI0025EAAC19|nr:hypothetical protein [uncultured Alistipes sp.]